MDTHNLSQHKTVEIPKEIRIYLESILTSSQVAGITDKEQESMILSLYAELERFMTVKLIEKIPLEHLEKFLDIQEKATSSKEVEKFLLDHVSSAQEIYNEGFSEFKQLYKNAIAKYLTSSIA